MKLPAKNTDRRCVSRYFSYQTINRP